MNPTRFNPPPWCFKLFALALLFGFSAYEFWIGFEFGKTSAETSFHKRQASSALIRATEKEKSVPLSEKATRTQTEIPKYEKKSGWSVFSHNRCSPFQVQYPPEWTVYPGIDIVRREFMVFDVNKATGGDITIKVFHNDENLSAEEWSEKQIARESAKQPSQPKLTIINEPYHTINGIKTIRRFVYEYGGLELINNTRIEIVFTKDRYAYLIIGAIEMSENEFFDIIETLVVGHEKDFPLYEQMKNQPPFKDKIICPAVCPPYETWDMDWCTGKIYDEATLNSCPCRSS
ncbi:MAG: hypothetical protein WC878_04590 [Candidatus Paceibacterota bacterium]|jgi:hypothetical protein